MPSDELLRRYAELIIRVGVNLQEGEDLNIVGALEHAPLARALAASAYRAGAHYVDVVYLDQHVKRALIEHGSDEALEWTPPWQLARLEYLHEHRGATISITGDPEPDLLADLDGERVGRARMKALAERGLEIVFEERTVNWTVAAFPNEGWARKVFGEPDVERLWELVARAVRLDEADPVEAWKQHVDRLQTKAGRLNERSFDAVRFRGPGTDLTVGLMRAARWEAGRFETSDGVTCVPNLPTEEVFTMPDARRTQGTVRSTQPLGIAGGVVVEGLELRFEDGRVVDVHAERGKTSSRLSYGRTTEPTVSARWPSSTASLESGSWASPSSTRSSTRTRPVTSPTAPVSCSRSSTASNRRTARSTRRAFTPTS